MIQLSIDVARELGEALLDATDKLKETKQEQAVVMIDERTVVAINHIADGFDQGYRLLALIGL